MSKAKAKDTISISPSQRQLMEWLAKPPLSPPGFDQATMQLDNAALVEAGLTTPFDPLADGWSGVEITDAGWEAIGGKPKPAPEDQSNKSASSSDQ